MGRSTMYSAATVSRPFSFSLSLFLVLYLHVLRGFLCIRVLTCKISWREKTVTYWLHTKAPPTGCWETHPSQQLLDVCRSQQDTFTLLHRGFPALVVFPSAGTHVFETSLVPVIAYVISLSTLQLLHRHDLTVKPSIHHAQPTIESSFKAGELKLWLPTSLFKRDQTEIKDSSS